MQANDALITGSLRVCNTVTADKFVGDLVGTADTAKTVNLLELGNASNGQHDCNNITYNAIGYYTSNGPTIAPAGATTTDGAIYSQAYNSVWSGQIAQDYRDGDLYVRGHVNGTWSTWLPVSGMRAYNLGSVTTMAALKEITNTYPPFTSSASITDGPGGYIWYNIMWIPHRSGKGRDDNSNYGQLFLWGMTASQSNLGWKYTKTSNTWYGPYSFKSQADVDSSYTSGYNAGVTAGKSATTGETVIVVGSSSSATTKTLPAGTYSYRLASGSGTGYVNNRWLLKVGSSYKVNRTGSSDSNWSIAYTGSFTISTATSVTLQVWHQAGNGMGAVWRTGN